MNERTMKVKTILERNEWMNEWITEIKQFLTAMHEESGRKLEKWGGVRRDKK